MTENFDSYNAPQFFDFSKDLHVEENTDAYFEVDHENVELEDNLNNKNSEEVQAKNEFKEYYHTPPKTIPGKGNNEGNNECEVTNRKSFRRTMSTGDLNRRHEVDPELGNENSKNVSKATSSTTESLKKPPNNKSNPVLRKTNSNMALNKDKTGPTRTSAPRLTRASSRENLNRLAQPKRHASAQNLSQDSYVPMAEAVRKFQSGTPRRFRSKPNLASNAFNRLANTVPQSPVLKSKARQRQLNILSREEQELLEYEECQKFKIKAHPLNKKILGPLKPLAVEKKPATVPEPFNIRAPPQKVMESPKKETFEFHAKPVPKTLHEAPKLKEFQKVLTKPQTPPFMKRYVKEPSVNKCTEKQGENKNSCKLGNTKTIPFSFEMRDRLVQKKKEEMKKKLFEEEKRAREFHARPVPKAILNSAKNASLQRSDSSNTIQANGRTKSEESLTTQFKARPPTVLYKKPFEPKRDERHLIEITEFQLNTEMRAREREEFEQLKREKEERIALAKQMEEQMMLQREEEEVARIRKEAEYKAQPIKKYKELKIQPSGKVTEPVSPKFHTNKIRNKDKENKENSSEN